MICSRFFLFIKGGMTLTLTNPWVPLIVFPHGYSFFSSVIGSKEPALVEQIADITGPLACVVSRKAVLHR